MLVDNLGDAKVDYTKQNVFVATNPSSIGAFNYTFFVFFAGFNQVAYN